jgi:ectoine hydroxylase-related dioxygenase (phytanoyl-CoA dioxygenase family)
MVLDEVDRSGEVHADLAIGEIMAFSANHFHGTGSNPGPASRISVELRLVCEEDRSNGVHAPNVDFHGAGELSQFRALPS